MQSWDLEDVWNVGLMILFALGGYVPFLMYGLASEASQLQYENAAGSSLSRAIIAAMCAGALLPIAHIFPRLLRSSFLFLPLLPYFVWALASLAWSQDPSVSERKLFSFVLTCVYGFYFATRFPLRRQLGIVLSATSTLAVASILMVLFTPQFAVDHAQHLGAWQGVFSGKNPCAATMVVGLAAALTFRASSSLQRALKIPLILLFAGIISQTDSSGAVIAVVVLLLSMPLVKILAHSPKRSHVLVLLSSLAMAIVSLIVAIECLPAILRLLHRDPTFTGRTRLWTEVFHAIALRPWLGYGYGAFWLGLKGKSADIAFAVNWTAPHAHNGFLDIWLSLGGVGLALFIYSLVCATARIWRLLRTGALQHSLWMVSMVILVITFNLGESVLISAPSLMWILYVAAIVGLQKSAVRKRIPAISETSPNPSLQQWRPFEPALISPRSNS
jgi:O-antigen ligase